jgi:hypothetical protein
MGGHVGSHSIYDPKLHPRLAKALYKRGLDDRDVSDEFGITYKTLLAWCDKYPEFAIARNEGKEYPNAIAVRSAFQLCTGYDTEEVHMVPVEEERTRNKDGNKRKVRADRGRPPEPRLKIVKVVRKHVDPNPSMLQFWLRNRLREDWPDSNNVNLNGTMTTANIAAEMTPEERQRWLEEHGWKKVPVEDHKTGPKKRRS